MKAAKPRRPARGVTGLAKQEPDKHEFTLEEARTRLGQLIEMAVQGRPVRIVHGEHRLVLQSETAARSAPQPTSGYFAACHTQEEIVQGAAAGDPMAPFGPGD